MISNDKEKELNKLSKSLMHQGHASCKLLQDENELKG